MRGGVLPCCDTLGSCAAAVARLRRARDPGSGPNQVLHQNCDGSSYSADQQNSPDCRHSHWRWQLNFAVVLTISGGGTNQSCYQCFHTKESIQVKTQLLNCEWQWNMVGPPEIGMLFHEVHWRAAWCLKRSVCFQNVVGALSEYCGNYREIFIIPPTTSQQPAD